MPDFSNRLLARFAGQRFSYRWYSDIQLARQGIVLEQNKEPALSGGILIAVGLRARGQSGAGGMNG